MYEIFCAECKREMRLRHMKNADLANATGFKKSTIDAFFSNIAGRERSSEVARAVAKVLNLDLI